eukprot:m.25149 g.25149  ORF g.25149 m.25149 type:complete len:519 (+) comp4214_c0_seq1:75-1631(+)
MSGRLPAGMGRSLRPSIQRLRTVASHVADTSHAAAHSSAAAAQPQSSGVTLQCAEISRKDAIDVTFQLTTRTLTRTINTSWLRHNCPKNMEPSSGQRIAIEPRLYAPPCPATTVRVTSDGTALTVTWASDGTQSTYSSTWLAQRTVPLLPPMPPTPPTIPCAGHPATESSTSTKSVPASTTPHSTPYTTTETLPTMAWDTVMGSDVGQLAWLDALAVHGCCLLTQCPHVGGTVLDLANAISRPQATIYGTGVFDVVSVPKPINIAYSPLGLPLHQDLVYYESPPGLQFLHCLDFADTVQGGESTLLDSVGLLEDFRHSHPHHFATLCQVPALFQKIHYEREEPVHMTYHRPIISVNPWGRVTQMTWSPPFEGPLPNYGPDTTAAYYAAYCALTEAIEQSPRTLEFRLRPGDMITFNNRRTLHGRRAFSSLEKTTPRRHLQGTYVNIDDFKSKRLVLQQLLSTCSHSSSSSSSSLLSSSSSSQPHLAAVGHGDMGDTTRMEPPNRPPLDPCHVWNQDAL